MNYKEALEYIHGTKKFGSKLGLKNITRLLQLLDNPHEKLKFIHVAGTNGKGSTSSFISNILIEEGYKVGLFTSPYLEVFNERIRINNINISDDKLGNITEKVKKGVDKMIDEGYNHPTEFEIVTAIAFLYYFEEKTDIVVLEVGLGGRFDSTNVINKSLASVITSISLDHMDILGDTIDKIAYEKAGIIKRESKVISYPQKKDAETVLLNVSEEKKASLDFLRFDEIKVKEYNDKASLFDFSFQGNKYKDLEINLIGKHQIYNACLALKCILVLSECGDIKISENSIRNGLKNSRWMGRLELIRQEPRILIDGAHNVQGIQTLVENIETIFSYDRLILIIGLLRDKDVEEIISIIAPKVDRILITEPENPRKMIAKDLSFIVNKYNSNLKCKENIKDAIELSYEEYEENDLILIAGSLYLIGEARKIINKK
ncbi:bifunctional folylpolyglutamate synthase/dihydrofolate synthase [Clostridium sp. D2Q-14]|uniref:bifunctional folylpolyglutamate synthase/dihydrofolate synthase n=1 Tax=Anaeromonas gelatinilytica TaxID=2683194 RepID=UPI00193AF92D|nr:folylpolyglutamate synthase/dihydrofolate synthase family protein [Anaeromonas gelatinilytica]MBS4535937.1 bifunctional folylpolyglutamate synthase/dihydrofolate synthase [Anaeromonas gelatinilytica]